MITEIKGRPMADETMPNQPFNIYDVIEITNRMRDGDHVFTALVVRVERNLQNNGWSFTYVPCSRPDSIQCGFGCAFALDTPGQWGIQSTKVVGREYPRRWDTQPVCLYKNPGYDSVNL